jgi:RNA polymerase sigma-70 factor (ECF subfamily)
METLRPLLLTYAYNILGIVEDAKDIVQDAFLKFSQLDHQLIADKKAYLVRMVINLSINRKKKQQKVAAAYPGQWLPEPIATERADTVLIQKDVLSYSLMVLLERLDAKQRAVFILKEAFDYDHAEIGEILGITEDYSRKILSRAKIRLKSDPPIEEKIVPPGYLDKYIEVIRKGDTQLLEKMLAEEVAVISDGGGKVSAFRNLITGRTDVSALLLGIQKKFYQEFHLEQGWINHEPALFYYQQDVLINCQVFSIRNDRVDNIYFIRNPDKLAGLQKKSG